MPECFHLSACAWTSCVDTCPIYLWFCVGALKAAFISSFSGITHFITYVSAACAFITRAQPLSSPRQLSAQARSHSQIQSTSTTYLSSAGGRSRLPFEDVLNPPELTQFAGGPISGQAMIVLRKQSGEPNRRTALRYLSGASARMFRALRIHRESIRNCKAIAAAIPIL